MLYSSAAANENAALIRMTSLSAAIRESFPNKKIVIIGDLVADQFLYGTISRVSREAPVLILSHDDTETLAGGAANAAVNVASLGGNAILIGVVGKDANGRALLDNLSGLKVNCDFVSASDKVQTTTKVRVLAGQYYAPRQQVIRIDYENKETLDDELHAELKENLLLSVEKADAIIISDYDYGVANEEIAAIACKIAADQKIPLLVDSRFNLKKFPNAATATPNQDEVEQVLGKDFTEQDCVNLCEQLGYQSLLVTCGNKGMLLIEREKPPVRIEAVGAKEPIDVTGAGDTVIAVYALGLASGLSFLDAANLANHAGGIVVMKKGTASVSSNELLDSLRENAKAEHKTNTL